MDVYLESPKPFGNVRAENHQESNLVMAIDTLSLRSNLTDVAGLSGVQSELQNILEQPTEPSLELPTTFHPFPRLPTELRYRIISPSLIPRIINLHLTHLISDKGPCCSVPRHLSYSPSPFSGLLNPCLIFVDKTHFSPHITRQHTFFPASFFSTPKHPKPPLLVNPFTDIVSFESLLTLNKFLDISQGIQNCRGILRAKRFQRIAIGYNCNPCSIVYKDALAGYFFRDIISAVVLFGNLDTLLLEVDDGHGERYAYEDWDVDEQWPWLGYDGERDNEYEQTTIRHEDHLQRWHRERSGKDSVLGAVEKEGVKELARRMLGEACEKRLWVERKRWDGIWEQLERANGRGRGSCKRWFVPKVEVVTKEEFESRF